jgi:hypothetical protein
MERSDEIIRECAPRVKDPVHGLCQIDFGKFGRRPRTNRTEGEGDNVSIRRAHI